MDDKPLLLPCPFCGGGAHVQHIGRNYYVICSDDLDTCMVRPVTAGVRTEEQAVEIWNRRA